MEHLILYYGACLMGLICLISMLAVYKSNKRVLRDLKNPTEAKDKWMSGFVQEHEKLLKENTEIHNPSVYVIRRMRGRKIGPWNMRQIKGISWGTFILSFLLIGMDIFALGQGTLTDPGLPFLRSALPSMSTVILTGIGMGILLLGLRILIGTGYQEEEMETNLLDYVENRFKEPDVSKIIPMENVRKKENKERREHQENKDREHALRQMEQGILETAATDSRYSHLLSKEEEAIVKDVVKEFLT